ncbi:DUF4457-containing protein [Aureococcus anophagefferens]|nr:DUF4457-containing protein [Aureococcus anophagefferens]
MMMQRTGGKLKKAARPSRPSRRPRTRGAPGAGRPRLASAPPTKSDDEYDDDFDESGDEPAAASGGWVLDAAPPSPEVRADRRARRVQAGRAKVAVDDDVVEATPEAAPVEAPPGPPRGAARGAPRRAARRRPRCSRPSRPRRRRRRRRRSPRCAPSPRPEAPAEAVVEEAPAEAAAEVVEAVAEAAGHRAAGDRAAAIAPPATRRRRSRRRPSRRGPSPSSPRFRRRAGRARAGAARARRLFADSVAGAPGDADSFVEDDDDEVFEGVPTLPSGRVLTVQILSTRRRRSPCSGSGTTRAAPVERARFLRCFLDGVKIFEGEVRQAPGTLEDCRDEAECVLFTYDAGVLATIEGATTPGRAAQGGEDEEDEALDRLLEVARPSTADRLEDSVADEAPVVARDAGERPAGGASALCRIQIFNSTSMSAGGSGCASRRRGATRTVGLTGLRVLGERGPVELDFQDRRRRGTSRAWATRATADADKLFDGCHATRDDAHMWLVPFDGATKPVVDVDSRADAAASSVRRGAVLADYETPLLPRGSLLRFAQLPEENELFVFLDAPRRLAGVALTNYAKTPSRGVRELSLFVDGVLVSRNVLKRGRGRAGRGAHVLFTHDRHDRRPANVEPQDVLCIDENQVSSQLSPASPRRHSTSGVTVGGCVAVSSSSSSSSSSTSAWHSSL